MARSPRRADVHSARPVRCAASRRRGGPHTPADSEPHQSRRQHAHLTVQDRHQSVRPPRGRGVGSRPAATRGAFSHLHDCLGDASRRRRRGRRSLVPSKATDHHHEDEKMAEDLSSYMREHYNTLIYKEAAVRRRVIHAANRDLLEFVGEITDMARELRRKYPSSPPPEGEGGAANPPRFTLLREFIGRSSASLLGRMDTGLDVLGSGSGPELANKKRKVVTSKVADNNNNGRSKSSWGLVRTIADKKNAQQACVYYASGRACPRNDCSYEHGQQLGALPSPSPPPPFLPLSRNRRSNSSSRSGVTERLPPL